MSFPRKFVKILASFLLLPIVILRAFSTETNSRSQKTDSQSQTPVYGGQAVVQGVMMKGPEYYAVSVHTSKGIVTELTKHQSLTSKSKFFRIPFIRGIFVLIDMMIIGYKSLYYSADVAMEDDEEEQTKNEKALTTWMLIGTMALSIGLAIVLFKLIPLGITTLLDNVANFPSLGFNAVDGLLTAIIFILYIYIIGRYKDMQELFRYHGGEHKAINCLEAKEELSLKNIFNKSTVHRRCGTTFTFVVLVIAIFVYLFIPKDLPFLANLALRIALVPFIAGISYELQRYAALNDNKFFRAITAPGLALQALTVNMPQAKHNRTARAALQAVLSAEEN